MKKIEESPFDFYSHVMRHLCDMARKKNWILTQADINLLFGRDLKISDNGSKDSILNILEKRGDIICQRKLKYILTKIEIPWIVRKKYMK